MRYALILMFASACAPELYSSGSNAGPWEAPENDWVQQEPPGELSAVGWQEGQVPPDARLVDQFGNEVSLWQFYGQVVLFDVSTMWCAPCQDLARHTEATWSKYRDDGFVYVTVLAQDPEGGSVSEDELNEWGNIFGITAPILADNNEATAGAISQNQYPAVLILDRKMRVAHRVKTISDEDEIDEAIEDAL